MDEWGTFNETSFPKKDDFYDKLKMENITDTRDADRMRRKRVCNDFEINNLGEYHGLYFKCKHYYSSMFLKTLEKCL